MSTGEVVPFPNPGSAERARYRKACESEAISLGDTFERLFDACKEVETLTERIAANVALYWFLIRSLMSPKERQKPFFKVGPNDGYEFPGYD